MKLKQSFYNDLVLVPGDYIQPIQLNASTYCTT